MRGGFTSGLQRLESAARRSWLAGFLPFLRERTPWLHRLLLQARDRLVPYASTAGVTRYQHRAICRFHELDPAGRPVGPILEIGSDEAGTVVADLSALAQAPVIGVNPVVRRAATQIEPPRTPPPLVQADARDLPFAPDSVASIFSVATLEHINGLERALDECYRVLMPGGILYADFGPIWSCSVGHHVYARVGDEEARHWKPGRNPVPNYAHLLLSREELGRLLKARVSPALLEAVLQWIYDLDGINRLFFEDYHRLFRASAFRIVSFTPILERVSRRTLRALRARHPGHEEFRCRMIEVVLKKPLLPGLSASTRPG